MNEMGIEVGEEKHRQCLKGFETRARKRHSTFTGSRSFKTRMRGVGDGPQGSPPSTGPRGPTPAPARASTSPRQHRPAPAPAHASTGPRQHRPAPATARASTGPRQHRPAPAPAEERSCEG